MTEPIVLVSHHALGREAVKQRVTERFEALKDKIKFGAFGRVEMHWQGDTAYGTAKALGQAATGTLAVTDEDVTITIHLPALLAPFRGAIVALIEKQEDVVKPHLSSEG